MKRRRPLSPAEMYPASERGVVARIIVLESGIRVRVAESGPQNGTPVVMLHGWGASLYMYRHALASSVANSMRAIAVDLRGFGLSDKPRWRGAYTLDAYCADLDALLDALAIPRVALLGHSMGGGLALRYALRRPERLTRVALINPVGLTPVIYPKLLRPVPRLLGRVLHERLVPRSLVALILRHLAYGNASCASERDIDEYWAPTQQPGYVHAAHAALREFDWRPLTAAERASLTTPCLVVLGTHDRVIRAAITNAAALPNAHVQAFSGGHCVHEELSDEVYLLIRDFLR
ncbi:MAG TPA: alpha/beta fold hydrolase [Gemmatimonadaceae bacterium]